MMQEYELAKSDAFFKEPLSLLPQVKPLLLLRQSEIPYTLQQAYFLAAYFRALLDMGRYSEPDKKLIRDLLQKFPSLNEQTQGSFLNFELNDRAIRFMLDTKEAMSLQLSTNVLQLMTLWVEELPQIQKLQLESADFDLYDKLNSFVGKLHAFNHIEDRVLFLSVVHRDILAMLPEWAIPQPRGPPMDIPQNPASQASKNPRAGHLISAIAFLNESLPKILYNIVIRAQAFAREMLIDSRPQYDLLYLNQGADHLLGRSSNFSELVMKTLSGLVRNIEGVELGKQSVLLDLVFRYYYAYHKEQKSFIYPLLLDALNGLAKPVRYALTQQIMLFLTVVNKLGHGELAASIKETVQWVRELAQKSPMMACPKNTLEPLFGSEVELTVPRGTRTIRVLQVFREYSLLYFDVQCRSADIGVRFVYAGAFSSRLQQNRTIFERERLKFKDTFKGSVEVILPGIYYFEFDNSYSWLTSKTIAYRTVLLSCMEIEAPSDVAYLRMIGSQLALKKDKLLKLGRHLQPHVEYQTHATCEVLLEANAYRLVITASTKDNYEYELEGATKQSATDKLIAKIRSYFSGRNYDKTVFKLGELQICSLKEFTNALRRRIEQGQIEVDLENRPTDHKPNKNTESQELSAQGRGQNDVIVPTGELQPKTIAEVDSSMRNRVAEQMIEETEEQLD